MNVPAKTAKAIATGRATIACLPLPRNGGCPVKPGHETPVQPGGRKALCRVRVLTAQGHRLGDTTFAQARAMGHRTTDAFKAQRVRTHDQAWLARHKVDLIDNLGILGLLTFILNKRFDEQHAKTVVWLVTFELIADPPRFLAVSGRGEIDAEGNADYTHQRHRAIDDLEVIDRVTQERYAKTADAFCVGRQMARKREAEAKRIATRAERHPAPWWKDAA